MLSYANYLIQGLALGFEGGLTMGVSHPRKNSEDIQSKVFKRHGLEALELLSVVGPCIRINAEIGETY